MPTILYIGGWRLFFYTNERNEPPHIHVKKGDMECKYWLHAETFDIEEAYAYNLRPADRRIVRKIIFEHFEYLLAEYQAMHQGGA
ncbi:MAG: DUF4160 domain-containing protein [Chloroflexia bacterium]|nr:DUF4160 domain-containing protein [Chloroflexia bacterium]